MWTQDQQEISKDGQGYDRCFKSPTLDNFMKAKRLLIQLFYQNAV